MVAVPDGSGQAAAEVQNQFSTPRPGFAHKQRAHSLGQPPQSPCAPVNSSNVGSALGMQVSSHVSLGRCEWISAIILGAMTLFIGRRQGWNWRASTARWNNDEILLFSYVFFFFNERMSGSRWKHLRLFVRPLTLLGYWSIATVSV